MPKNALQRAVEAPAEPHSLVWCRVLRRFPGASRVQVAVAEAVTEYPRETVGQIGRRVGRSKATVSRIVNDPQWVEMYHAYLLQRKDLCRDAFRLAMDRAVHGIVARQAKYPDYQPKADEIALLKLVGQYTGELGADQAVNVAINQGTVIVADRVTEALKSVGVTVGPCDRDAKPVAAVGKPVE